MNRYQLGMVLSALAIPALFYVMIKDYLSDHNPAIFVLSVGVFFLMLVFRCCYDDNTPHARYLRNTGQ